MHCFIFNCVCVLRGTAGSPGAEKTAALYQFAIDLKHRFFRKTGFFKKSGFLNTRKLLFVCLQVFFQWGISMTKNFRLLIEYDGTACHGWQRQKNERTVQGEIEKALETMCGRKITLNGSGRTDAGVHALGQTASFRCETRLTSEIFLKGLNSLLDPDIVIRECAEVPENFHARFDAKDKTYHYRILNRFLPSAIDRHFSWFIRTPLDTEAMRIAALHLMGEHDFRAFEGIGSPRAHTVRHVFMADLENQEKGYIVFKIRANGFLRFMVRNIVGTLVSVGLRKIAPDDFREIMLSKDRARAGATAPPQGLFLMCVNYDDSENSETCPGKNRKSETKVTLQKPIGKHHNEPCKES